MQHRVLLSTLVVAASLLGSSCKKEEKPASKPDEPTPTAERPAPEPAPVPAPTPAPPSDAGAAAAPAALSDQLIGGWKTPGADFEELTIEADGSWASHLHARPLYSGQWTLAGTSLSLSSEALGSPIELTDIRMSGEGLNAKLGDDELSWTRIPAPEEATANDTETGTE